MPSVVLPKAEEGAGPARAPDRERSTLSVLRRDALVCLSLANLLALRLWAGVLDPATSYFLHEPRPASAYVATLLLVLLLGALGAALATAARRFFPGSRVIELALAAVVGFALWGARNQVRDLLGGGTGTDAVFALAAGVPLAGMLFPAVRRVKARNALVTLLLVLSPFVGVTAYQALDAAYRSGSGSLVSRSSAARHVSSRTTRVVVVLFDELDQFRMFEDRAPGIELPVIDGLRAEGYHGTRARYPANKTELAIPSLFAGRRVVASRDAGASDRRLVFEDGESTLFSDLPTFLSDAASSGRNSALAGWYHPYCRILGDDLAECVSWANRQEMLGMTLREALVRQIGAFADGYPQGRKLVRLTGLSDTRMVSISPEWHIESLRRLHADSIRLASDPDLDVVFLHYPVPHVPGIWDAAKNEITTSGTYDGNLELTDRSLGELIDAMRASGVWERTALVVLADHPKRGKHYLPAPSPRLAAGEIRPIPFLVRPAGGIPATVDDRRFSSLALHDLVPRLLDGRARTAEDLREFFTTAPADPSPGETAQP